ncbi:hypothetical protein BU14_0079s0012 [Porphyra umbilicalis]|uniref:Uncharacterized protein n=1 Tax=Porphyra umbilicalis TaxID=2786 RepID=A0A1X6PEU3_PORUM|nr:hypothetical protein BU14_0079s0012 [Porphyra umbilicalis]|eukprot:OSX79368.1 hypothetical protein BU14_0079s0012 [Porphyra umbilicalis]
MFCSELLCAIVSYHARDHCRRHARRCQRRDDGGGGGSVQRVVYGLQDRTLRAWDAGRGKCVGVLSGH